jgi:RNA polymerase sigma-70 factor (ECF subfamily)
MDPAAREKLEQEARTLAQREDFSGAASMAVRGYGPEIFGFLVATHRSEQDASDVFSDFTENLVRGLPKFAWHCSLRTWAYTIARNASHRHRRDTGRREKRRAGESALDHVADAVRSSTLTMLRTQSRTRLDEIRSSLPPEDRELLVLRLDRDLSWNDLALALHDGDELTGDALKTEAARLRKRFQILKERLREMARREGLIS